VVPASLLAPADPAFPGAVGPRTGRDQAVDAVACLLAAALGVLVFSPALHDTVHPLSTAQVVLDVVCGSLACLSLWWRRRWPFGVALACVLLGTFSSARPTGPTSRSPRWIRE
jgi:multisubunit Na+/H+ antiporter MnhF subunit